MWIPRRTLAVLQINVFVHCYHIKHRVTTKIVRWAIFIKNLAIVIKMASIERIRRPKGNIRCNTICQVSHWTARLSVRIRLDLGQTIDRIRSYAFKPFT
jgi:hypothetical protein